MMNSAFDTRTASKLRHAFAHFAAAWRNVSDPEGTIFVPLSLSYIVLNAGHMLLDVDESAVCYVTVKEPLNGLAARCLSDEEADALESMRRHAPSGLVLPQDIADAVGECETVHANELMTLHERVA